MAFMSFSAFFYARNDLRLFTIKKKKMSKCFLYSNYTLSNFKDELNFKDEIFFYQSLRENLFKENDAILISNLGKKIILFKNFTQNLDNFKEASLKQILLSFFLFLVSVCFTILALINEFASTILLFLMPSLLLLAMAMINLFLLFKQIHILKKFTKEQMYHFLSQRKYTEPL